MMNRRLLAEAIGSLLLAAAVIGSGVMAERLAGGNAAIALLANTGATVAALAALIAVFAPVSGAHFNPAVSGVMAGHGALAWRDAAAYAIVQIAGCCAGAILVHAMFELPLLQFSSQARAGLPQWLAEFVATVGLILVIAGGRAEARTAWMVAAWIGAAYWFTSSTSFANPAITIARAMSDTFTGIRPADVPAFVLAQALGALAGFALSRFLFAAGRRLP
jgi:glycerol uptake facilitator-like aquaporin